MCRHAPFASVAGAPAPRASVAGAPAPLASVAGAPAPFAPLQPAAASGARLAAPVDVPTPGSRRRRLWELDAHAHCPVVGVCLPMAALRRLADKLLGDAAGGSDYELHGCVVARCRQRTPLAEALQRELDRRYAGALRLAARSRTTESLAAWWREASASGTLAGAFWAVLTHARCTPALEHQVLGEVHMLQHQVGMATRVELGRFEALIDENAVLARQLAEAQQRATRDAAAQAHRQQRQEEEIARLRAAAVGREEALSQLRARLQALDAAAPGLPERVALAQDNERLVAQVQALHRRLLQARQETERQRRRADELEAQRARRPVEVPAAAPETDAAHRPAPSLHDHAVLCVGGRTASVPVYRALIEDTGGRFLHHDGGEEDNAARLESTLAAADLVICQTGCISHDAYWRVKDHCKRTGKRCLFVETPSRSGLERALHEALQRPPVAAR